MYNEQNIFAQIISGKIPAKKIYEDDELLAIHDINPAAPVHVLVLPKGKYIDYQDFISNASQHEIQNYFSKISEIATMLGLNESGYRLVMNKGKKSGQTVFHFHTHIVAGKELHGF